MAGESESKKFLDRLKEASVNVAQMTREQIETLQAKRELSQTYGELGRKAEELVQSGAIAHGDLTPLVDRIAELKAQLEAAEAAEPGEAGGADEAPPPAESEEG